MKARPEISTQIPIDWELWYRRMVVYVRSAFHIDQDDARDAAQDIIERVLKGLASFDTSRPMSPWIYAIARHYMISRNRRDSRRPSVLRLDTARIAAGSETYEPQQQAQSRIMHDEVEHFIDALSLRDREIAFLRFYEKLGSSEIGSIVGAASATVRYRIHRIRKRLGEFLEQKDLL